MSKEKSKSGVGRRGPRMRRQMACMVASLALLASSAMAEAPTGAMPTGAAPTGAAPAADATHAGHGGHMAMKTPDGVISLDVFEDGERIYLLTASAKDGARSLQFRSSADGGRNWSKELPVPIPAGAGAQASRGADAQLAKIGDALVVMWMSHIEGAPHGAGPMVAMRSIDGGKTWTQGPLAADWAQGPHGFISIASDGKRLHATWLDSRDGKPATPGAQGLRYAFSADAGATWSKNMTLDDAACACCWTTGKADRDGNLFVLYRDKQPSDMAIGVIDAKTHGWTRLATVGAFGWDFPGCPHIGGALALRGSGKSTEIHALVGTRKKGDAGVYHLKSTDGGHAWGAPARLGDESATHGDIAARRDGVLAAVWDMVDPDANDGSLATYAATSADGAVWSTPVRLSAKGANATHPRVVATKQGFLTLWTEQGPDGVQRLDMKSIGAGRS